MTNRDLRRPSNDDRIRQRRRRRSAAARRKMYRRRRILLTLVALLVIGLVVFGMSKLIGLFTTDKSAETPTQTVESTPTQNQTATQGLPGETATDVSGVVEPVDPGVELVGYEDKLMSFRRITKAATLYANPDEMSTAIGDLPQGSYAENYGVENNWRKLKTGDKIGYTFDDNTEALLKPDEFKVKNGVLVINKIYSLPMDYDPGENPEAREAFDRMQAKAKEEGITISIGSGYRSFDDQTKVHNRLEQNFGEAYTDSVSAVEGHSEHQSGLAYDIIGADPSTNINASFGDTKEATWLKNNAHLFGFHLRYPKGKELITGYIFEPWHYRYLGETLATGLYNSQLVLEEYLGL